MCIFLVREYKIYIFLVRENKLYIFFLLRSKLRTYATKRRQTTSSATTLPLVLVALIDSCLILWWIWRIIIVWVSSVRTHIHWNDFFFNQTLDSWRERHLNGQLLKHFQVLEWTPIQILEIKLNSSHLNDIYKWQHNKTGSLLNITEERRFLVNLEKNEK
jgi:hypothetical protein